MSDVKIQVGVQVAEVELDQMRRLAHVDTNSQAVLVMARKGVEAELRAGSQNA